jgi:Cell wall-active antibiotics response 4TMS YvqF
MLDARGYAGALRAVRALLLFKLGFWAGSVAAALLLKRAFPSRGDAESDELALVAIFDGIELESRASAFRGGSIFTWWGGVELDLRDAKLAPSAQLDVRAIFGGIAMRVPPGWRVESEVRSLAGGVAVDVPDPEGTDAPTLRLSGFTAFGGVAVKAKAVES